MLQSLYRSSACAVQLLVDSDREKAVTVAADHARPARPPEATMPSSRLDEVRDYVFADDVLRLRKRMGLTQRELAREVDVSVQSIHAWESGLSYPGIERLQALIALFLQRGAFESGREEEEAAALWETVRERAPRRTAPFD